MVVLDCISDLHGHYPPMPGGELLIVAGDLVKTGRLKEYDEFFAWMHDQDYIKKIYIAGNHDSLLPKYLDCHPHMHDVAEYLCDSATSYEGLNIWGSPWTPTFGDWAFMKPDMMLEKHWDMIPQDTDILITHGPCRGVLDKCVDDELVGSESLSRYVKMIKPALHICGHIHESKGMSKKFYNDEAFGLSSTTTINCSHMNEDYVPDNHFKRLIIKGLHGIYKNPLTVEASTMVFRRRGQEIPE